MIQDIIHLLFLINHKGGYIDKTIDLRTNQNITAAEVLLIDQNGQQAGVVKTEVALRLAQEQDLDLVEIAPQSRPVVCKILNYGKYKYRESKKRHEARTKQKVVEVKEIKFHLIISRGDYEVKLRNAVRFLGDGNRVKVSLWLRGREIAKQDLALARLTEFSTDLAEYADVEQKPNLEGKRLSMLLVPKKKKD